MRNLILSPKRINREMDTWFDDFFRLPNMRAESDGDFMPRVNIRDGEDKTVLTFEVPGMKKDDFKITIHDGTLSVSGERHFEKEDKKENFVRSEIYSGKFCRSFTLPDTVDTDRISADYKDGLLEIELAKLEEVKPKQIEVKVG